MEYIVIIIILIILATILGFIYEFNLKKLKRIGILEEEKFNKYLEKYPTNIEICKYILNMLNNNQVIVEEDKNAKTSLYIALTNKIIIADVKNSYTRIQTIAHECLHSIQSKKIILFNFIYSNIYICYFVLITFLGLVNKVQYKMLFLSIMIIFSYIYYFVRSYLENDAMIKAKYLAKDYMNIVEISSKKEIEQIIDSYDKLNDIGIKMTNYELLLETIIRIIIVSISFLI